MSTTADSDRDRDRDRERRRTKKRRDESGSTDEYIENKENVQRVAAASKRRSASKGELIDSYTRSGGGLKRRREQVGEDLQQLRDEEQKLELASDIAKLEQFDYDDEIDEEYGIKKKEKPKFTSKMLIQKSAAAGKAERERKKEQKAAAAHDVHDEGHGPTTSDHAEKSGTWAGYWDVRQAKIDRQETHTSVYGRLADRSEKFCVT